MTYELVNNTGIVLHTIEADEVVGGNRGIAFFTDRKLIAYHLADRYNAVTVREKAPDAS